ncbi:MAG: DNA polymerase/3'-5' exonuclease PolX [Patescibacteria group bacterium]
MLTNKEIAEILTNIAEYLAMEDIPFKPRAYEKVAESVLALDEEISGLYKRGGRAAILTIPGVGASIADHVEELIKTGKLAYYEQLKLETPVDLATLTKVEGLGPKKIKRLYEKLKIKNLDDLEKAAKAGTIGVLEGFGKKSEENILKGIEFVRASGGRMLLGNIVPEVRSIEERLRKVKAVEHFAVAGSIRRRKETVGDIDILVVAKNAETVMDAFTAMPEVARVYAKGPTKSMVRLKAGIDADLRVVPPESYGAALNYFTGSKDHNVHLRKIAISKGMKLNEYGLYKKTNNKKLTTNDNEWKLVAGKTEEEIYSALGLEYIPPEMREDAGEVELAEEKKLPKLIDYGDLKGDLQTQTNWTDGADSIRAMADAAMKAGLEYIVITDHTKRLAMTGGLDEKKILEQIEEIRKINGDLQKEKKKFRILAGSECDILKDGSLDISDDVLAKLDVVGISVHSYFNLPIEEQTARVVKAMHNPHADILFHPTGRRIGKRPAYPIDMEEIIAVAKKTGTILEIDAFPDRLDLKDDHIRKCVKAGVKMSIDSDAHSVSHFSVLEFGISQARRGWVTKGGIINTYPVDQMLKLLKNRA